VKDFEPRAALDGGPDGLAVHRRIWSDAPAHLAADGQVLLEIGYHQAQAALAAAAEFPSLTDLRVFKDYAGRDRVIAATRR
jgi:release factor glutamine methyltransferase